MAKIEADKLELMPVQFNFEHMLQKALTVIHFRSDERMQTLTVNVDKNIPRYIVGDDQRLIQILTNLLSNAVRFTHEFGTIHLEASLAGETDGQCELRVEITDNGIGIAPEDQDRLFTAFEQAQSGMSRDYGGTGLGLAITKRIVEMMGGNIWVESEIGKGSKFTFTVKVVRGR
jgi:signal transduction histidine kinase